MKKKAILLLGVMMMMVPAASVSAEELEVQLIGGDDAAVGAASLDDVQLGEVYEIDGFARIEPLDFQYVDFFPQYVSGMNGVNDTEWDLRMESYDTKVLYFDGNDNYYYLNIDWINSGKNAEFAWFLVDITNKQKMPVNFMDEETTQVKVIFDDEYEYAGWVRQFNYDYDTERKSDWEEYGTFIRGAIRPDSAEEIDMMYTGHYVFGCTLPNAVMNGDEPLSMVITLGDSEITYNIRK